MDCHHFCENPVDELDEEKVKQEEIEI